MGSPWAKCEPHGRKLNSLNQKLDPHERKFPPMNDKCSPKTEIEATPMEPQTKLRPPPLSLYDQGPPPPFLYRQGGAA